MSGIGRDAKTGKSLITITLNEYSAEQRPPASQA